MRHFSRASLRRSGKQLHWVSIALLALIVAPYGAGFIPQSRGISPAVVPPTISSFSGAVFWNTINTNSAPNPSSAISATFSSIANVEFAWTGPVLGAGVSQAFLVVLFLGLPAYTKQQVESSPLPSLGGSINMTYDLTQFKWFLQGLYQLHAYLEDPSGNTVWSETFYLRVAQPYDVVVATVALLIITVLELYMIATVGPRAADKVRSQQQKAAEESEAHATSRETPGKPPEKS